MYSAMKSGHGEMLDAVVRSSVCGDLGNGNFGKVEKLPNVKTGKNLLQVRP